MIDSIIDANGTLHELNDHTDLEYPVGVYHLKLKNFELGYVRWHWHEEIEINYIKEGSYTFLVGDESIILSAGDAIFINQNLLHAIHPFPGIESILVSIVFHPSFLFGHDKTYLSTTYLLPVLASSELKYFVIGNNLAEGNSLLENIKNTIFINTEKNYGYEIGTKSYLCQFWLSLLKRFATPAFVPKKVASLSLDEIRVKEALLFIAQHYSEPLSLENISSSVHISKSECCRCFKRILKLTPFQYLIKYRIFQSARMMRMDAASSHSISELATTVGFNNTSYYNKLFKQYLHCTPSEYKALVGK